MPLHEIFCFQHYITLLGHDFANQRNHKTFHLNTMLELNTEKERCGGFLLRRFSNSLLTLNNLSRDSSRFFRNFDLIIYPQL